MKVEPSTPLTKKHHAYSTTNANPIGLIELIDVDVDSATSSRKQAKTASGGSTVVRFDSIMILKVTRRSTRSAKANNPKMEMGELFRRLGQEFRAVRKTFEEMAQAME